jgi:hypothetical protein
MRASESATSATRSLTSRKIASFRAKRSLLALSRSLPVKATLLLFLHDLMNAVLFHNSVIGRVG